MRVNVDINNVTTVSVVLSESNLRELSALVELQSIQQERGRAYTESPYLIKNMGDLALFVSVENDLIHYQEDIKV